MNTTIPWTNVWNGVLEEWEGYVWNGVLEKGKGCVWNGVLEGGMFGMVCWRRGWLCLEWCVGGVGRLCLEWCVGGGEGCV